MWGLPSTLLYLGNSIVPMFVGSSAKAIAGSYVLLERTNRRRGYAPGEGILTPVVGGDKGIVVSEKCKHPIGRNIARLSVIADELRPFRGKRFMFTMTEGEQVTAMLGPALKGLNRLKSLVSAKRREDAMEEAARVCEEAHALAVYLKRFPARRKTTA